MTAGIGCRRAGRFCAGECAGLRGLAGNLLQVCDFARQPDQQGFKLWAAWFGKDWGLRHIRNESHRVKPEQAKNAGLPGVLPLLHDFAQIVW
jgi:hypothetical protein